MQMFSEFFLAVHNSLFIRGKLEGRNPDVSEFFLAVHNSLLMRGKLEDRNAVFCVCGFFLVLPCST